MNYGEYYLDLLDLKVKTNLKFTYYYPRKTIKSRNSLLELDLTQPIAGIISQL